MNEYEKYRSSLLNHCFVDLRRVEHHMMGTLAMVERLPAIFGINVAAERAMIAQLFVPYKADPVLFIEKVPEVCAWENIAACTFENAAKSRDADIANVRSYCTNAIGAVIAEDFLRLQDLVGSSARSDLHNQKERESLGDMSQTLELWLATRIIKELGLDVPLEVLLAQRILKELGSDPAEL